MPRPLDDWHGFFGQRRIVKSLRRMVEGAQRNGLVVPHFLLSGPSGSGKSKLAQAIAESLQTTFVVLWASRQTCRENLAEKMGQLKKADVFFIDEIHALKPDCQESLYQALTDDRIPVIDPATGKLAPDQFETIDRFTLIGATDQPGKLFNAFRNRFPLKYDMQPYSREEMRQIAAHYASKNGLLLTSQAITRVANASRGLPREVEHIMHGFRMIVDNANEEINKTEIEKYMNETLGIDHSDLRDLDRRYLREISKLDGRASIGALAVGLGTDDVTLKGSIENYLCHRGFVRVTPQGRMLTEIGKKLVEKGGAQ